jgi:hypothetical protein
MIADKPHRRRSGLTNLKAQMNNDRRLTATECILSRRLVSSRSRCHPSPFNDIPPAPSSFMVVYLRFLQILRIPRLEIAVVSQHRAVCWRNEGKEVVAHAIA